MSSSPLLLGPWSSVVNAMSRSDEGEPPNAGGETTSLVVVRRTDDHGQPEESSAPSDIGVLSEIGVITRFGVFLRLSSASYGGVVSTLYGGILYVIRCSASGLTSGDVTPFFSRLAPYPFEAFIWSPS